MLLVMFVLTNTITISYPVVSRSIYHVNNALYITYSLITVYFSGQWIVPEIIGECPPPCNKFTLTSLPNNRAMLFGFITPNVSDNTMYMAQCTNTSVVSII